MSGELLADEKKSREDSTVTLVGAPEGLASLSSATVVVEKRLLVAA